MQKRTELQIAQDRAKVCELLLQGIESKAEIAEIINLGRSEEQHISSSQIHNDIEYMKRKHQEKGIQDYNVHLNRLLDELKLLKRTYWKGYELSRRNKISVESDFIADEEEYNEVVQHGVGLDPNSEKVFNRMAKVREEVRLEGNVSFLQGVQACIDKEAKLLGMDVNKVSLTDNTGQKSLSVLDLMKEKMNELSNKVSSRQEPKLLDDGNTETES